MNRIQELDTKGQKVLMRVDYNVPLDKSKNITDDTRITGSVPTLRHLLKQNAKIILASHLGRPDGQKKAELSLAPVANFLSEFFNKKVLLAPDCIGTEVEELINKMHEGDILLLENLRFHNNEKKNDDGFSKKLAKLCDIYVNDAFAVSHRAHASVEGITRFVKKCAAGFLLQKELDYFNKAMKKPERPLLAILGGAKVETKLPALKNMLAHVDKIIIGGAAANTFIKSMGYDLGKSLVDNNYLESAKKLREEAVKAGIEILTPLDVVLAKEFEDENASQITSIKEIPHDQMIMDIGPETVRLYRKIMRDAKTIIWNGPMGVFEKDAFNKGSLALAEAISESKAMTIVGGGDTNVVLNKANLADKVTYMSTGGGAFLKLMEGQELAAVAALKLASQED